LKIHTKIAALAGAGALLSLGLAATPALAGNTPVSVTAPVTAGVGISLMNESITFPATPSGQTASVASAESYTVVSNAGAYSVTITPGWACLDNSSANQQGGAGTCSGAGQNLGGGDIYQYMPNSSLSLTGSGGDVGGTFNAASPMTVVTGGADGTASYSESWSLAIPAGQAAAQYGESFTYAVIG
jgi:hypothetical protein